MHIQHTSTFQEKGVKLQLLWCGAEPSSAVPHLLIICSNILYVLLNLFSKTFAFATFRSTSLLAIFLHTQSLCESKFLKGRLNFLGMRVQHSPDLVVRLLLVASLLLYLGTDQSVQLIYNYQLTAPPVHVLQHATPILLGELQSIRIGYWLFAVEGKFWPTGNLVKPGKIPNPDETCSVWPSSSFTISFSCSCHFTSLVEVRSGLKNPARLDPGQRK